MWAIKVLGRGYITGFYRGLGGGGRGDSADFDGGTIFFVAPKKVLI